MKALIPHLFTLGNLLLGILAIINFMRGDYETAIWMIGGAAFLDFFDGFVARALGVSGELGKQLDSLADLVSFGVAPALGLYTAYQAAWLNGFSNLELISIHEPWWHYLTLFIALFSAFRLAKFNIDTRQSDRFIGLPTPANSILILSIVWGMQTDQIHIPDEYLDVFILGLTAISCVMLVAELPLLALKFKHFKWAGNQARYLLILGSIGIFIGLGITGLSLVVLLYLFISIIDNRIHRHEVSR